MNIRQTRMMVFGVVLLLSGAVSHSSWEPPTHQPPHPDVNLTPGHPWIALTFDDGPHPVMTEKLLSVLKEQGVPATFFIVGKMGMRYPWIVQEMAREGNEVANHSFSHTNFKKLNGDALITELDDTRQLIRQLTGRDSTLYRPPGGSFSPSSVRAASKAGYHMVLWTVLTKDVNGASAELMRQRILHHATDGGIILMHSGMPKTVAMLPGVIRELRAKGYHFVTVSQLLGMHPSRERDLPLPLPDRPTAVALK